ncbi:MAG: hypothetical protein ACJAS6_000008 [Rickettsiales bacterium]|jgi:hypothetical protein
MIDLVTDIVLSINNKKIIWGHLWGQKLFF